MAVITTNVNCELQEAVKVQYLKGNLFSQDVQANVINVHTFSGGEPVTLSGTVTASVIREDGGTVTATGGTISGNVVSITLPAAVYVVPGLVSIVIKVTASSVITTIAAVVANVYKSSTDTAIDPGTIIPSVTALVAQIETAVASIPADYSSLWATIAPAFSSSVSYTPGQYVTYNGGLYICATAHTGSWNASHFSAVNVGGELIRLNGSITNLGNDQLIYYINETITKTGVYDYTGFAIPAGTYKIHFDSITSNADGTQCTVAFYAGSSANVTKVYDRGVEINGTVTFTNTITHIMFYAGASWNSSQGKTATFSNAKLYLDTGLNVRLTNIETNAAEANNDISNLEESVVALSNTVVEDWFTGSTSEAYTSSTFSGFATSYQNQQEKLAKGLSFWVRSRATNTDITKIAIRLESDNGTFVYEKTYDVSVGATRQYVTLPLFCKIPTGLIWVAVCANQIATFLHQESGDEHYKYWTNGDITHLNQLKESGGATKKLAIEIDYFTSADIPDASLSQNKLAFAEFIEPENLINIDDENQCKKGWWYYSTSIGSVVQLQQLSSQYHYVALTAKTYGASKITIDQFPHLQNPPPVRWVGTADENMVLLSYEVLDQDVPYTLNIPEGAVYALFSWNTDADSDIEKLMVVKGTAVTKYVKGVGELYRLKQCVTEQDNSEEENAVKLKLPQSYDLVVGDTFQLFKKGIVDAVNPENYDVTFGCAKGSSFERFFQITPTTAETLQLYVSLYDAAHNLLDSKYVNLNIRAKKTSISGTKYVLCVGDSLTTNGVWAKEFHRRLTGSGGAPAGDGLSNVQFIGTREYDGVHYEGYGGWTFNSYNTANVDTNAKIITCTHDKTEAQDQHSIYKDATNATWKLETIENNQIKIIAVSGEGTNFPATGTLTWVSGGVNHSDIVYTASQNAPGNPFWDTTASKVDFAAYCANLGVARIDYVFVLLGWNSAASTEEGYKASAQTFIDNVHASYPNAKIVLIGLQIPARDGLGVNYGATGIYSEYYTLTQYVFNLDGWYADLAQANTNVYSYNLSGQFDTEHNMPTGTRQVNTRNTETETYQTNGVHPATSGYMQIADSAYRYIESLL